MGGFTDIGGERPEQASSDDFLDNDKGIPIPPAGGAVFSPLQVLPTSVGYPKADNLNVAVKSPAQFCIRYLGPGGLVVKRTPFKPGLSLKHYLRTCNLIGQRMRCALVVGRQRVRMSYVPKIGEELTLAPPQRPLLQLGGA